MAEGVADGEGEKLGKAYWQSAGRKAFIQTLGTADEGLDSE